MIPIEDWPLFGLRIRTPRLELGVPTDVGLAELLALARRGVHDPATMPFTTPWTDAGSPDFERGALQYWWRGRAEFSPRQWDLTLAVRHEGRIIGAQNLLATDFLTLRSAETGSWLGRTHQGNGFGKEMRRAVLHLAFGHLAAAEVTSTAFWDNLASQHVSRAVGYEENGRGRALRRGVADEQIHFRITRDRWRATATDDAISVSGFEPCRSMFGLD